VAPPSDQLEYIIWYHQGISIPYIILIFASNERANPSGASFMYSISG
jgi:hypothetical protein